MKNSKKTKRTLLYSGIALILCFTMLFGTTFAWFTDTASTAVNKIQAGTLDIELLDKEGNSLEGETLSWQKAAGHENEAVLWEPGASYDLETVTIKNNGNLALKFKVVITGINGDAKLNEVIDWTVKVGDETYDEGTDISLAVGAEMNFTINGKMQTTAGNEYQGRSIDGVAITVYATQDTVEFDSTTNQYDKDAEYEIYVSDIDELRAAIASGEATVVLKNDIALDSDELVEPNYWSATGACMLVIDRNTTIDLNGHSLSYTRTDDSDKICEYGLYIKKDAIVNIIDTSADESGEIAIDNNANKGFLIMAIARPDYEPGVTVNLYGGHYISSNEAVIYAQTNIAHINIYGGKYETTYSSPNLLLNVKNYCGYIDVYGGSFKNFKPGVTNGSENKVADGYMVTQDGDWYTVVAE